MDNIIEELLIELETLARAREIVRLAEGRMKVIHRRIEDVESILKAAEKRHRAEVFGIQHLAVITTLTPNQFTCSLEEWQKMGEFKSFFYIVGRTHHGHLVLIDTPFYK